MRYRFKRSSRRHKYPRGWFRNPRRMKVADVFRKKSNLGNKNCKICGGLTQEGKLYCTNHVEYHPYIQRLLDKIEEKDYEELEVERLGEEGIDPDGPNVHDILTYLTIYGSKTVEGMARELLMDPAVLQHYVNYLASKGQVILSKNIRKKTVVSKTKTKQNPYRRRLQRYIPQNYDY